MFVGRLTESAWKPRALSARSAQTIPVRENRRHTQLRANETHVRGGGKPPHASRSSRFASSSRPRHREGSSSGNVDFCSSPGAAAFAAARYRAIARFEHNARLKFSREAQKSMSRPNCPHKLTKTAEPWLGGGAAFGRLRTARGRHVGCTSLLLLHVSRGSRRAARGRPARRAAFAA